MSFGRLRGFPGFGRLPILALLAWVGLSLPVAPASAGGPGALQSLLAGTGDATALQSTAAVSGYSLELRTTRGTGGHGDAPRRIRAGGAIVLRRPGLVLTSARHPYEGAAAARLARAGRLSAPSTAPPRPSDLTA